MDAVKLKFYISDHFPGKMIITSMLVIFEGRLRA